MATSTLTASSGHVFETRTRSIATGRFVMLDVVRLLAMYGIVWIHVPRSAVLAWSTEFARFAVPFFVASAVYFVADGVRRHPERTLLTYVPSRMRRIYLPFLAWSGVYLLFKVVKSFIAPNQPNDFPGVSVLWVGGAYHLWFLPFILAISVAAFAVRRSLDSRFTLWGTAFVLAGTGWLVAAAEPPPAVGTSPEYLLLMWQALPAAFWGLALGLVPGSAARKRSATAQRSTAATSVPEQSRCDWLADPRVQAGAWFAIVAFAAQVGSTGRSIPAENLAGIAILVIALRRKASPLLARLAPLGRLAFGIYFSHLLFVKIIESLSGRFGMTVSVSGDVATFAVAAVGATLTAWLLTRWHATRWLAA